MALHPELQAVLDEMYRSGVDEPTPISFVDRRRAHREMCLSLWPSPAVMSEVRDVQLEIDDRTLNARLYVPPGDEGLALMVYFHGGAFVVGDLDTHDGLCRRLSAVTKMPLISVEYRLAPESPFPAGVDDAIGAVRQIGSRTAQFVGRDVPIIIIGDSAGATLAAVAATATRDDDFSVAAQVLIYPTLGPEMVTESSHKYGKGFMLENDQLRRDYEAYLGDFTNHIDQRVSPLMSMDLADSPPAIVVVAQYDPLRDEALAYAGLLEHFDTPVEILEAEGMVHGFLILGIALPSALAILDDLAAHLHRLVEAAS